MRIFQDKAMTQEINTIDFERVENRKYLLKTNPRKYHRLWYKLHRQRRREQARVNRRKALVRGWIPSDTRKRLEILNLLGNKCANPTCLVPGGCSDLRCLQIDHLNGGGLKEYRKSRDPYDYYSKILSKIKSGSKEYQLLCANCNWIKRKEKKEEYLH